MFLNLKPVSVVTILGTLKGETVFHNSSSYRLGNFI